MFMIGCEDNDDTAAEEDNSISTPNPSLYLRVVLQKERAVYIIMVRL
ncbi:hypothetical protein Ct9H90mP29_10600 [bacterium]|nr:MAG: hypothetical protein Ct9H90mP29_10600 [bacterium]